MGIWTDLPNFAYRGPTVNQGGRMSAFQGVVLHIAEGSYEGTISWQKNPAAQVSSHFITDYDGKIAQMVDTDVVAWTQANGNGRWISIENAGFHTDQFTPAQVEACAQILAHAHRSYGVLLQITDDPSTAGRGLGWHGMGGAAWSGHYDCPGPANVALRQPIVNRAIAIVGGAPNPPEADMASVIQTTDDHGNTVFMDPQGHTFCRIPKAPAGQVGTYWPLQNKLDALNHAGVGVVLGTSFGWNGGYNMDDPATWVWAGVEVKPEGAVTLTDAQLAQITAAAQAGAEAGAPTHDELAQAAFEGAQRAEDE